jgi:superfamily II DNA/RNA helicase
MNLLFIQMQSIPLMLEKRQVLVCAPTGSGKTAAYLVPLVHTLSAKKKEEKKKAISAVIVAPTRELVKLELQTRITSYDRGLERRRCKILKRNKYLGFLKKHFFLLCENTLAYQWS